MIDMQTITHLQQNIHPIFDEFDSLYAEFSERKQKERLFSKTYDSAFKPLIDIFKKYGWAGSIKAENKRFRRLKTQNRDDNNIIVCFSSGKDSIATVKHYMDNGYNVYLYHMKHINPPLHDEYIQAEKLAEYWNIPIYVDTIKLSGNHAYVEHPMKNMIIANGALQYGIREKIGTQIAFGNYKTSSLRDDNFEFCGGDDIEMWDIYNKVISKVIPDFRMNIVLSNIGETLETICPDKELMDMSVSCLGRASMRAYWHTWVRNKFDIDIPTHRCGRCYKCCLEYIYMADNDLQTYNAEYYKYCFNNLKKNYQKEDGIKYTDDDVWKHYIFYDIKKSKYFNKQ